MFRHQQQLGTDGAVRSVQTLDLVQPLPAAITEAGARAAGNQYFDFLSRIPLLRIIQRADGGVGIQAPLGLMLLQFGPPAVVNMPGGLAIRYPIESGAVVQGEGAGQGYLGVRLGAQDLALEVEGYYARMPGRRRSLLRRWCYLISQNALHVLIAWLFLRQLKGRLEVARHGLEKESGVGDSAGAKD